MATLTIDEKKAREIYPGAATELKTILESTFGKDFFHQKITDRVKTMDDVYAISGRTLQFGLNETDEFAYRQLKLIAEVLNEGWKPNWDNSNEYKYYPWFYMDSSSGFRLNDVTYYRYSFWGVGSRLCFKSEALALHAVKHFIDIYKTFLTI